MEDVERGTPHFHCCSRFCSDWNNDPQCTDPTCNIAGKTSEGRAWSDVPRRCRACVAAENHREAVRALSVFGWVIATIARVGLIAHASRGWHLKNLKNAAYFHCAPEPSESMWLVYLEGAETPTHELPSPNPADRAAEVVSLLVGEVES